MQCLVFSILRYGSSFCREYVEWEITISWKGLNNTNLSTTGFMREFLVSGFKILVYNFPHQVFISVQVFFIEKNLSHAKSNLL